MHSRNLHHQSCQNFLQHLQKIKNTAKSIFLRITISRYADFKSIQWLVDLEENYLHLIKSFECQIFEFGRSFEINLISLFYKFYKETQ